MTAIIMGALIMAKLQQMDGKKVSSLIWTWGAVISVFAYAYVNRGALWP